MKKIFINKEIEILCDQDVEKAFTEHNDTIFASESGEVIKVNNERWQEAQYYERKTWCYSAGRGCHEDRNEEHQKHFNNYSLLKDLLPKDISVIELGCGPFTNIIKILPIITKNVVSLDLLDPLINDYILNSPNCTYKTKTVNFIPVNTYNLPIEKFDTNKQYDLVIMVNVLDHCFDIDKIFEVIDKILKVGGIFVFSEKCFNEIDLKISINNIYDAGHPIRLSEKYLNEKLSKYEQLYKHEFLTTIEDINFINKYVILRK